MASGTTAECCATAAPPSRDGVAVAGRWALVGNPNCGKTTLFNALTGLRAHTANYPGTTVERRSGHLVLDDRPVELIDLPGLYDCEPTSEEERVGLLAYGGALVVYQALQAAGVS